MIKRTWCIVVVLFIVFLSAFSMAEQWPVFLPWGIENGDSAEVAAQKAQRATGWDFSEETDLDGTPMLQANQNGMTLFNAPLSRVQIKEQDDHSFSIIFLWFDTFLPTDIYNVYQELIEQYGDPITASWSTTVTTLDGTKTESLDIPSDADQFASTFDTVDNMLFSVKWGNISLQATCMSGGDGNFTLTFRPQIDELLKLLF